jgi:hypothetical protein
MQLQQSFYLSQLIYIIYCKYNLQNIQKFMSPYDYIYFIRNSLRPEFYTIVRRSRLQD